MTVIYHTIVRRKNSRLNDLRGFFDRIANMINGIIAAVIIAALTGLASGQKCAEIAREVRPVMSDEARSGHEQRLAAAEAANAAEANADSQIWVGRRTAYLGDYKGAVRIFSEGISKYPNDARFYRHRGHRYLTLRCFDEAAADFLRAADLIKGRPDEIEPDGLPNAKNIPTSTLQSNIWYHLGLAYYLKGDLESALRAYQECQKVSKNNDMRAATAYWHYMTLRRLGKNRQAKKILEPFSGNYELIENADYLKLIKLFRGETAPAELSDLLNKDAKTLSNASLGYGFGNWHLFNKKPLEARQIFRSILGGDQWSSFGYIAAETELKRSGDLK